MSSKSVIRGVVAEVLFLLSGETMTMNPRDGKYGQHRHSITSLMEDEEMLIGR